MTKDPCRKKYTSLSGDNGRLEVRTRGEDDQGSSVAFRVYLDPLDHLSWSAVEENVNPWSGVSLERLNFGIQRCYKFSGCGINAELGEPADIKLELWFMTLYHHRHQPSKKAP